MNLKGFKSLFALAMVGLLVACGGSSTASEKPATTADAEEGAVFTLTSPDLESGTIANEYIFNSFGCSGGNLSPALSWANAPEGTKSFAITVYDADAPTGSGWSW